MTSQCARRAARGRVIAIVSVGFALAAGISWPAAIAAQPAPKPAQPAPKPAQPAAKPAQPAAKAAQPAPPTGPPSDRQKRATEGASLRDYVAVKSSLDRSAIWVGDRFSFIVDVDCGHGTDILTDDLSRDRLQLDELDILGVEETREDRGDGRTVYRFTYHLTTYSLEPSAKRIGEMRLRYYVRRPGQRPEEIEPAGEVLVPPAMVFVRSLLPDDASFARYRNERPPMPRATAFVILQRIGIGLVIVSIVPAALWVVALERQWRHRRRRQSVRKLRHDERESLDDVRVLDVQAEEGRKQVFDLLSALLRKHVTGTWGVSADGLTVAEINSALSAEGKGEVSAGATSFLETCEKARYGKPEELPSREACLAAIDRAEQLVGLGRS
jgi:hypothetical protein